MAPVAAFIAAAKVCLDILHHKSAFYSNLTSTAHREPSRSAGTSNESVHKAILKHLEVRCAAALPLFPA